MDNLTHTLTGVLLARAGLSRWTPHATWIAVIAANAPDVDVVSVLGGTDTYFTYHRWATHAIVFAPVMALLPVVVVSVFLRRKVAWSKAWLVALIAVASHLLLDFTNPYGIRLWLPFSDAWPALDATHVVDVWIWAALLLGVFWPVLAGLVGSEIGSKSKPGRASAIVALLAIVLYDSGRFFLHSRAVETLESRVYDGTVPRRAVAFPSPVNPMRWTGWVETEKSWQIMDVELTREFDPQPSRTLWKGGNHPAIDAASRLPIFQVLLKFSRTPYWRVTPVETPLGATRVELIELRFGRNGQGGFTATALVDNRGQVLDSGLHF